MVAIIAGLVLFEERDVVTERDHDQKDGAKGFAGLTSMLSNVETDVDNAEKALKTNLPLNTAVAKTPAPLDIRTPHVIAQPGEAPAFIRKRDAELKAVIASGLGTVELRKDGGTYLVNADRSKQYKVSPGDGQMARKIIADMSKAADTHNSTKNSTNSELPVSMQPQEIPMDETPREPRRCLTMELRAQWDKDNLRTMAELLALQPGPHDLSLVALRELLQGNNLQGNPGPELPGLELTPAQAWHLKVLLVRALGDPMEQIPPALQR